MPSLLTKAMNPSCTGIIIDMIIRKKFAFSHTSICRKAAEKEKVGDEDLMNEVDKGTCSQSSCIYPVYAERIYGVTGRHQIRKAREGPKHE